MHDKTATRDIGRRINLSLDIAVANRLIEMENKKRKRSDSAISKLDLQYRLSISNFSVGRIVVLHEGQLSPYEGNLVCDYQTYLNAEFYSMKNKKGL